MNCKNVEPLLSLYVGGDLEEEYSRLVAAHLQSCKACTVVADEYARAGQLLQGYEAPLFSEEIYAGVREQVLNEIARESDARARPGFFSELFLTLVRPRMRWITAALLLAISVTALYLSRNGSSHVPIDQHVAVQTEEPKDSNESAGPSSFSNEAPVPVVIKRRPKPSKVDSSTNDRLGRRNVVVSQPSSALAPLRVEMQTSNRNIRIIWLSGQRPGAVGTDGSKGI